MPSILHQILVELFWRRPSLVPELLRDALGQPLPNFHHVEISDADLSQIVPTEYRADQVLVLRSHGRCDGGAGGGTGDEGGADVPGPGVPVLSIVLEVQLSPDEKKRTPGRAIR